MSVREVEDRRGEVDVRYGLARPLDARNAVAVAPRDPHDQGQVDRLLVRVHLSPADPRLAEELAVVGDEDEHRSVELAGVSHRVIDLLQATIDTGQSPEGALPAAGAPRLHLFVGPWKGSRR